VDQFRVQQSFFMPDQGLGSVIVNFATKRGATRFTAASTSFFGTRIWTLAITVWKLSYAVKDGLLPIAGEKFGLERG